MTDCCYPRAHGRPTDHARATDHARHPFSIITYFDADGGGGDGTTPAPPDPRAPGSSPSDDAAPALEGPEPRQQRLHRTAKLLEQMAIADVDAVNRRDFDPATSALFRHKAPCWEATTTAALAEKKLSVYGFVLSLQKKIDRCPDFKLRIIDFTTTVDETTGRGEIFANMDVTDGTGVRIRNVTHLEFHHLPDQDRWVHVSHRTMPGIDPMYWT